VDDAQYTSRVDDAQYTSRVDDAQYASRINFGVNIDVHDLLVLISSYGIRGILTTVV
jgi:hypothetical protein